MMTTTTRTRSKLFSEKEEVQRSPVSSSLTREEFVIRCFVSKGFSSSASFQKRTFLGFHKCARVNPKLVV